MAEIVRQGRERAATQNRRRFVVAVTPFAILVGLLVAGIVVRAL